MSGSPIAVIPVRDGVVAAGGVEAAAEVADVGGNARVVLIGSTLGPAAIEFAGLVPVVELAELGAYAPGAWASALVPVLRDASFIVLPGSPDGRDLAGRLGVELGWPVIGGAIRIGSAEVTVTAFGGIMQRQVHPTGRFVATLQPGVRSVTVAQTEPGGAASDEMVRTAALDLQASARSSDTARDATTLSIEPPDAATVDLAEAKRIIGGGAGLLHSEDLPRRFEQLREIGAALGAAMGATRVVTDAGYIGHSRQIGTTGVVVNPDLYLAFGISGAVQHTSGLGHPEHIISVNTDPHCPMMALADLAVVADAPATLDELEKLLRNAEQTERHTND